MGLGRLLQNRPRSLDIAYRLTEATLWRLAPLLARLGRGRLDRWLAKPERLAKGWIFDCRMCGQCVLHQTGMTCPMTCPKQLRNGPCGGVRPDGSCEVDAAMRCVWVEAIDRARRLRSGWTDLTTVQPPLDHRLAGRSAWVEHLAAAGRLPPERGTTPRSAAD